MEFPDRLIKLRRERGLTQAELAQRTSIHPSQLHRYEAGTAQPTLDVIRRLSVALAVSSDTLLFADESRTRVVERLAVALETAAYLPEHDQHLIAEIVEAIATARMVKNRPNMPRGPVQRRLRKKDD